MRRDIQAVNEVIKTMAQIGENFSEARRDSMVLGVDFSGAMPIGVSDIEEVLAPIHESIRSICQDAAKQPIESIVQECLSTLGRMIAHAMSMTHVADHHVTAPLAHSPVYYLGICVKIAIQNDMEDALLTAVKSLSNVFANIKRDLDTDVAEATALNILSEISIAAYRRPIVPSGFKSVEMMLLAAQHDVEVRGFRDGTATLRASLRHIAALVQAEVTMDLARNRILQTFPPYSLGFEASIVAILAKVAEQVKRAKPGENPRFNLFHEFKEASEVVAEHYRQVAVSVKFECSLLEKWLVSSIFSCAKIHIQLLKNPPAGSDKYLDSVAACLRRLIFSIASFFNEEVEFPYGNAKDACMEIAILGMECLRLDRPKLAKDCADAIYAITKKSVASDRKDAYQNYGFADCIAVLEQLARAAQVLGHADIETHCRSFGILKPEAIADEKWPQYREAVVNRVRHLDRSLMERGRQFIMPNDSVGVLRQILAEARKRDQA